jgi:hypothetical protein
MAREAEGCSNGQHDHDGDDNLGTRSEGLDEDGSSDGHEAGIQSFTLLVGLKGPKLDSGSWYSKLAEESIAQAFPKG